MSNSAVRPSTISRFRPAICRAVQNYIAKETSTLHQCPIGIKELRKKKTYNNGNTEKRPERTNVQKKNIKTNKEELEEFVFGNLKLLII